MNTYDAIQFHFKKKDSEYVLFMLSGILEFPDKIKEHELYLDPSNHDKKILTCCTGGIKCETASAYLKQLGFKNIICNYIHERIISVPYILNKFNELKESDVIIISAPIYNYGPPATLKAWCDLAARVGETFRFKPNGRREGLLKNKRAYLVVTSGGTKLNSSEDFLTPWLKFILNFFGIEKVDVISADQMALDYEKSILDAEKQIKNIC